MRPGIAPEEHRRLFLRLEGIEGLRSSSPSYNMFFAVAVTAQICQCVHATNRSVLLEVQCWEGEVGVALRIAEVFCHFMGCENSSVCSFEWQQE